MQTTGLLLLRLGIGAIFAWFGWQHLTSGMEGWKALGGEMGHFGVDFGAAFWGLTASLIELIGGALLIAGYYTRCAAFFMFLLPAAAAAAHVIQGDVYPGYCAHAGAAVVLFSMAFMGAGKGSLDWKLRKKM